VQDVRGTNNANFATPPELVCATFLLVHKAYRCVQWPERTNEHVLVDLDICATLSPESLTFLAKLACLQPRRDGALENDIVVHEMTHGISNRKHYPMLTPFGRRLILR
jgi:hypothetical protein